MLSSSKYASAAIATVDKIWKVCGAPVKGFDCKNKVTVAAFVPCVLVIIIDCIALALLLDV